MRTSIWYRTELQQPPKSGYYLSYRGWGMGGKADGDHDTRVEVLNLSGTSQTLQCFYVQDDALCSEIGFVVYLTAYQPIAWLARKCAAAPRGIACRPCRAADSRRLGRSSRGPCGSAGVPCRPRRAAAGTSDGGAPALVHAARSLPCRPRPHATAPQYRDGPPHRTFAQCLARRTCTPGSVPCSVARGTGSDRRTHRSARSRLLMSSSIAATASLAPPWSGP